MDLKAVIETSTEALTEQAEKVAANVPSLAHLAETPLGQQIASIVTKAGAKAEEALHNGHKEESDTAPDQPEDAESAEADEDEEPSGEAQSSEDAEPEGSPEAGDSQPTASPELVEAVAGVLSAAGAKPPTEGEASEIVAAVEAASGESGAGSHKALVIGGSLLAAGAAAAAAVVVYRRRRGGQEDEEGLEGTEGAIVTPITTPTSDADDAGSPQEAATAEEEHQMTQTVEPNSTFAHEIDEEAEHFAKDFVDHIDDEDAEEILDPEFTIAVDAEADHFAQELIDHIEVTDADVAAEEELEKQS